LLGGCLVASSVSLTADALSYPTILNAMQALHGSTVWPVANSTPDDVESTFGPRWQTSTQRYDFHRGLDFDGVQGDDIRAVADGVFWGYRDFSAGGRTVILRHELVNPVTHDGVEYDYYYTYCMHLYDDGNEGNAGTDDIISGWTEKSTVITAGQHIGEMGNSGSSGGTPYADHLHFEVRFLANTSLEYQLDPDNAPNTQYGFDPHIHPSLLWSNNPADGFWPNNYSQQVAQVGVTEANQDLTFRYTSDDETPALNAVTVEVIDADTQQVVKSHTLNFSTREGFDASSTTTLDDPDETMPYFSPTTFGDTALEFTNELIVPASWVAGYDEDYEVKVTMSNIWTDSTDLTVALVPEPRFYAALMGILALGWVIRKRRFG